MDKPQVQAKNFPPDSPRRKMFKQDDPIKGLVFGILAIIVTLFLGPIVGSVIGVIGFFISKKAIKEKRLAGILGVILNVLPVLYLIFITFILGYIFTQPRTNKSTPGNQTQDIQPTATKLSSPTPALNSEELVIPEVIDQWIPQVRWEQLLTETRDYNDKKITGSLRKGTLLNPDLGGNPYEVEDLLTDKNKISSLGWERLPPIGASGPLARYVVYSKKIGSEDKVLIITIKNTTYLSLTQEEFEKTKCPCINEVEVFQEK